MKQDKLDDHSVRVSIGLPVYNGEKYLEDSLTSMLSQSFTDFELIISDNASTDGTKDICKHFAQNDHRIRYYRNDKNLGAAWNFNRVFELSRGEYFKWAAHDDLCLKDYLQKCVTVLDQDKSIILCHTRHKAIDEQGAVFREYDPKPGLASPKPHERFYECICVPHPWVHVFGVIRSETLAKTGLIRNFSASDIILMAELTLLGRLYEVPEPLFLNRKHAQQSLALYKSYQAYQIWFDPSKSGRISFPHWRLLLELFLAVNRAPVNLYEKIRCYLCLPGWIRLRWRQLARNLKPINWKGSSTIKART